VSDGSSRSPGAGRSLIGAGAVLALVLVVVIAYGGYGRHWRWIGVNGNTATLWDWLHLLLLPIAAVTLSLWLRHRPRASGPWGAALGALAIAFVCVVIAGYMVPWGWTGFVGNTLWDWLNLGALPLAVALVPVLLELRTDWGRRHAVGLSIFAVAFIGVVLAGYLAHWRWTGFVGNTVWDWLHLLLLPLLVPAVIVPALRTVLAERFANRSGEG
jgi:hypothetical protein